MQDLQACGPGSWLTEAPPELLQALTAALEVVQAHERERTPRERERLDRLAALQLDGLDVPGLIKREGRPVLRVVPREGDQR